MGLVSENQVGAFSSPANGQDGNADVVLSNDNTVRQALNAHDADATIHVQSSVLASRPAAGTAERLWVTTDGKRAYLDNGTSWDEVDYLCKTAGGTVTGATTFSAAVVCSAGVSLAASSGTVTVGTSVTTGASAGDVVLANTKALRAVNNAGTNTRGLIQLAMSSDAVRVAPDGNIVTIGSPPTVTSAAADEVVLANTKAIRAVNAAATDTFPLIKANTNDTVSVGDGTKYVLVGTLALASFAAGASALNGALMIDSTNNRLCYFSGGNRYYLAGTSF